MAFARSGRVSRACRRRCRMFSSSANPVQSRVTETGRQVSEARRWVQCESIAGQGLRPISAGHAFRSVPHLCEHRTPGLGVDSASWRTIPFAEPSPAGQHSTTSTETLIFSSARPACGGVAGTGIGDFARGRVFDYWKTMVLWPLSRTRCSQCQRTARDSASASASRPTVARRSGSKVWSMRMTSCSMIGPSSRSGVT